MQLQNVDKLVYPNGYGDKTFKGLHVKDAKCNAKV
jgi:hypothetical protein